jgi:hypothetical protein
LRTDSDFALDGNQFRGTVKLAGGSGFDIFDQSLQTVYLIAPNVTGFEHLVNDV